MAGPVTEHIQAVEIELADGSRGTFYGLALAEDLTKPIAVKRLVFFPAQPPPPAVRGIWLNDLTTRLKPVQPAVAEPGSAPAPAVPSGS